MPGFGTSYLYRTPRKCLLDNRRSPLAWATGQSRQKSSKCSQISSFQRLSGGTCSFSTFLVELYRLSLSLSEPDPAGQPESVPKSKFLVALLTKWDIHRLVQHRCCNRTLARAYTTRNIHRCTTIREDQRTLPPLTRKKISPRSVKQWAGLVFLAWNPLQVVHMHCNGLPKPHIHKNNSIVACTYTPHCPRGSLRDSRLQIRKLARIQTRLQR